MLVERAYKSFSARNATKAIVLLGVSAIALIVSAVLNHMRTDAGSQMMIHVTLMATAAVLMAAGVVFLRKARAYKAKATLYAGLCSGLESSKR